VSSTASITSGTSAAENDGPTTLPGTAGPRQVRAVGAAQRDLVPLLAVLVDAEDADVAAWWWPQLLMQPEMLRSISPMS
jgi:hypothetical protein